MVACQKQNATSGIVMLSSASPSEQKRFVLWLCVEYDGSQQCSLRIPACNCDVFVFLFKEIQKNQSRQVSSASDILQYQLRRKPQKEIYSVLSYEMWFAKNLFSLIVYVIVPSAVFIQIYTFLGEFELLYFARLKISLNDHRIAYILLS